MAHPDRSSSLASPLALPLALLLASCGGGGAAAGPTDPSQAGAFAVHRVTVQVSADVSATRCAPSRDGGASVAAGPFPLVLIRSGRQIGVEQYDSACRHLASWGLVALVLPSGGILGTVQDEAAGLRQALDWALSSNSGLAGVVDAAAVAAAGHSGGGAAAVLAAVLDSRIRAVVGWDPVDDAAHSVAPELMGGFTVPLAVLGETLDGAGAFQNCAPAADNFTQFYAAADGPALQVTLAGAAHMDFVDDRAACGISCSVCQVGTADGALVRSLVRRTTVAFLRRNLLGEVAMDQWLIGSGMQADATAGRLAFTSK